MSLFPLLYLLCLTLGWIFFFCTLHCTVLGSFVLDHLRQTPGSYYPQYSLAHFIFCQIFNGFEYMSSNLHLMLSSLTTLTTSETQFIRNPLGTITRVPAYFQLLPRFGCPLQLQAVTSCAWCTRFSLFCLLHLLENYLYVQILDNQLRPTSRHFT